MVRTALALILVVGCSSEAPRSEPAPAPAVAAPAPKKKPAPTARWSSSSVSLSGSDLKYGSEIGVIVIAGKLLIRPMQLPIGTVLEIAGQRLETKEKFEKGFEVSLEAAIADLPWAAIKPTGKYQLAPDVDMKLTLAVTLPGYETLTTPVPPRHVTTKLEDLFVAMATTDKAWPGETTAPSTIAPAAAWTQNGFEAMGTADKVRDVRIVVIGTRTPNTRTRHCSGYIGARDFTATSYDMDVKLVDRATKQTVATKKFLGQPSCPSTVLTGPGGPASDDGPAWKPMRSWITAQVAKLR